MERFALRVFKIKLKVRKLFINPVFISFLVFIFFAIIIIRYTTIKYGYDDDFFKSVLIEAHGMLFDLCIIGGLFYEVAPISTGHS